MGIRFRCGCSWNTTSTFTNRSSVNLLCKASDSSDAFFYLRHRGCVGDTHVALRAEAGSIRHYSVFLLEQSLRKVSGRLHSILQTATHVWKRIEGSFGLGATDPRNVA